MRRLKNVLRKTIIYKIYSSIKYNRYPMKLRNAGIILEKPNKKAIGEGSLNGRQLIVSLTSFPERIKFVHKGLYSLMNQEYKPNRIILWLSKSQFPEGEDNLTMEVLELKPLGLEICWVDKDIRSYKKLIPALEEFKDDILVTADDDLYYPSDWLKKLVDAYLIDPDSVHCHLVTRLMVQDNSIFSIKRRKDMRDSRSYFNKILGGSGVLYPPHSLDPAVMDEHVFLSIAPTSDDIWFWAMAVKHGTKIHWIPNHMKRLYYIEYSQESTPCLTKVNDQEDFLFVRHLNAVAEKFGLLEILNNIQE